MCVVRAAILCSQFKAYSNVEFKDDPSPEDEEDEEAEDAETTRRVR